MNHTARQFNLKCIAKSGNRVVIRMAPGFNVVDDDHWEAFVPKKGKMDPYVAGLKKRTREFPLGQLEFGPEIDDMELEMDPDTKSKSKSEPIAKLRADMAAAEAESEKNKATAEKAIAEAAKAKVELEKAQLELDELKTKMGKGKGKDDNPTPQGGDDTKPPLKPK